MPIGFSDLGLILTLLTGGLSAFLRAEFSEVDPKDTPALLDLLADKLKNNLVSMVLQEIDDDIQRSTLSSKKEDNRREEYLIGKRQTVASELTKKVWKQAIKFQELKAVYKSWDQTYSHGRLSATICMAIYLFLFAILVILVLTKALSENIQSIDYWIAFIIFILPSAYVLVNLLVAYNLKRKYKRLSEGFDEFTGS